MFALRITCAIILQVTFPFWVMTGAIDPVGHPSQEIKLPIELPINIPCPEPQLIIPCECTVNEDYSMDMDCSDISSEEELRTIFNKEFPFTNFNTLTIWNNKNLTALKAGSFGNSSFVEIVIEFGILSEIEDLALMSSYDTLESLYLYDNKLSFLPDINFFKRLTMLSVQSNDFTVFPMLNSVTLQTLYLSTNEIQTLPVDAIYGLPSLREFNLYYNNIAYVVSGTFTNNTNLETLFFNGNNLTTLPKDAIQLHGHFSFLDLSDNQITHLPQGALSGVNNFLGLQRNSMKTLDEQMMRPLLEDEVRVALDGNPFLCECDIAWLITNQTLMDRLWETPTCSDGTSFFDLDPAIYEALC